MTSNASISCLFPWYLFHSMKTVELSKNPGSMYHIQPLQMDIQLALGNKKRTCLHIPILEDIFSCYLVCDVNRLSILPVKYVNETEQENV